jgi:hypothetical protein
MPITLDGQRSYNIDRKLHMDLRKRLHRSLGPLVAAVALLGVFLVPQTPHAASAAYYAEVYQTTNGFDTCDAKSQTMLSDWWNGTPWWEIGMYLGGSVGRSLGCYDGAAAVDAALNTGYGVVPYWYGPQLGSPCNMRPFSSYISLNTATAYSQGVSEANSANSAARAAGLPLGTPIFYDMESYNGYSECRAAASAFINGWDYQLNKNTAFWGSAYGSSCASYPSDWASIPNVPFSISPSDAQGTGLDNGSVYGYPCLSDRAWAYHQRVGQFSQDSHCYNNYFLYIDENCADAQLPTKYGGGVASSCSDLL